MKVALVSLVLAAMTAGLLGTPAGRRLDVELVHRARALDRGSRPLHVFMQLGTSLGDHRPLLLGALTTAAFGTAAARATAGVAFVAVGANQALTGLIKWIVNRERPDLRFSPRSNSSFPSGHASASVGLAYVLAHRHRRLTFLVWACAVWISVSRVFLERHYPSDVLAGALVGILLAVIVLRFEDRLAALTTRGSVRPPHAGHSG